jgi:hypothetical protein
MKTTIGAIALVAIVLTGTSAFAQRMNADDLKWINQCLDDNQGSASAAIIRKYCVCMNEKMDSNETRTITQWEKANPRARAACDRESGWR